MEVFTSRVLLAAGSAKRGLSLSSRLLAWPNVINPTFKFDCHRSSRYLRQYPSSRCFYPFPSLFIVNSGHPLKIRQQDVSLSIGILSPSFPPHVPPSAVKTFSTSSYFTCRSYKSPFEQPQHQSYHSSSHDCKRRRSIIGLNNNVDCISDNRTHRKEIRLKVKKHFGNIIRKNLLVHNRKLHERLLHQRGRNSIIRGLPMQSPIIKEDIKTIPNLLTTLRMASAPLLAYLVVNDFFGYALTIFILAGLTDLCDGYIARNYDQKTAFGTALDPLADKLLISCLTISLTTSNLMPVPLAMLILSRDAGLVLATFYFRYISLAPPRTLARYFDFSHVTAKIYPSTISKINTGFQLAFVACTLAAPVFDFLGSHWLQLLMYATGSTTLLSAADYIITWRRRLKFIRNG